MNDPITALGIVCIVSAIIGGGFSAAGYTIPGIKDWWRQLLLGIFGVVLISSAHLEWLRYMTDLYNRGKKPIRSLVVAPNQGENTWVTAGSPGSIYVRMYETVPPRDDKKEPYGLRVTICPPYTVTECPSRQMADGDIFRVDAPVEGRYRIDIQNFSVNPPLTVNAEIRYPE